MTILDVALAAFFFVLAAWLLYGLIVTIMDDRRE